MNSPTSPTLDQWNNPYSDPDWAMRWELMRQSYTTRLDQLFVVKAN